MANIREIQTRINSVKDTMKITNAMYMISSSKMKQAKKKLVDTEPFFYGLQGEISRILRHVPDIEHPYFDLREKIPASERRSARLSSRRIKDSQGHITIISSSLKKSCLTVLVNINCLSSENWGDIIFPSMTWKSIRTSSIPSRNRRCTAQEIYPTGFSSYSARESWTKYT